MKFVKWSFALVVVMCLAANSMASDLAKNLQDISVTIKSGSAEGSGVIITRDIKENKDSKQTHKVNFVWTAGHVIEDLRTVRTVITSEGKELKTVDFKDADIVQELVENGRRVGELKMEARVIKYSDAKNGHDLALLMIRKRNFVQATATFHLDKNPVPIGTPLYHVGSLLGQDGANSMTSGIMSQIGRVLDLGSRSGKIFDQTTATAFPGSSGGGIFFAEGDNKGKYVGMLVRGAGEGFNLIVPVRRMQEWCKRHKLMWALDPKVPCPTLEELEKIAVEDAALEAKHKELTTEGTLKRFPFLIKWDFEP